jgi:hypothetical protein
MSKDLAVPMKYASTVMEVQDDAAIMGLTKREVR